jgi:glycosyltransferase involved in cell wall biosynthesis
VLISFAIPAFNASRTIARTLDSVFGAILPEGWRVEAIVVDDGSEDGEALAEAVAVFPTARLVRHPENLGMCAGRNSGVAHSQGDLVIILDADDELVVDWPQTLAEILREWPHECRLCYAACRNQDGVITAAEPDYCGRLDLDDLLNERHAGEYLPVFRGDYVRATHYVDLGMRKSCGIVSYLRFAHDAPFWVTNQVLRIYHDAHAGSVTRGWTSPAKAAETARCYQALFERYGELYRQRAPRVYQTKLLRLAVYLRLAGLPGAWVAYRRGAAASAWRESLGAAVMLLLGGRAAGVLADQLKKTGWIRRYG